MPITTEPAPNPDPETTGWVKAKWLVDDQPCSSTLRLSYAVSALPTTADLATQAAALIPAFANPSFLGNLSAQVILTELELGYSFGGGTELVGVADTSEPGLEGGAALPLNAAIVFSLHTGERYRGGKGRMYIPGAPDSAQLSLREWTDDFVGAMATGAATMLSDIAAAAGGPFDSIVPCVRHQFLGGAALDPPVFTPITSISIQRRICTQRRRLGSTIS